MSSRSRPQILEELQRQKQLLSNKFLIAKLPDKGAKITAHYEILLKELEALDRIEESCNLMASLNLQGQNIPDKSTVENIEWENGRNIERNECLDSDDDSDPEDPLHIIASSTNVQKKIIYLKPEKKLISDRDLKDIEELKNEKFNGHTEYLCNKTDNSVSKERFKPHKTLKTLPDEANLKMYSRKNFENTAATPPAMIHGPVKEISIKDSLNLMEVQNNQLKKIQMQHASEKLAEQFGGRIGESPVFLTQTRNYREPNEASSESEDSDKETSDQEVYDDETKEGGIIYTVSN